MASDVAWTYVIDSQKTKFGNATTVQANAIRAVSTVAAGAAQISRLLVS